MRLSIHKTSRVLALFICATIVSVAQQISEPPPETGTIVGTVLDVNGGAVPNAKIIAETSAPAGAQRATTEENGSFKIEGIKPGMPYRIIVSADKFATWTSPDIVLQAGQYFILTGIELRIATVESVVTVVPTEQLALEQVRAAEKQRIGGILPNFYVVYEPSAAPLSTKLKFHLAIKILTDPVTIAGFGFNAAIYQMTDYPSYRQGALGYAERLGATFAGGYTKVLVGDAILPSLLHQDPRYFRQGTGTTKSRLLHALSSPFITKGDNGGRQFNYSSIGGDLVSGAIANAYYPAKDRGAWRVFSSALIGAGGRMALGVVQEFVFHKPKSKRATRAQDTAGGTDEARP